MRATPPPPSRAVLPGLNSYRAERNRISALSAFSLGAFGVTLHLLPSTVPEWFVETFVDGHSTRVIWTHFMGIVLNLVAAMVIAVRAVHRARVYARVARRRVVVVTDEYRAGVEDMARAEI